MNSITIAGIIGRDAEIRSTPKGEQVASFSIADGQGRDKPTVWWRCQLWGKRAEALSPYLIKGAYVTVSGNITQSEYTDKSGEKKTSMDVRVNDVALQGGRSQQSEAPRGAAKPASKPNNQGSGFYDMDDDIPF